MDEKRLLTVPQVAWLLQLHPKSVYRLCVQRKIPFIRLTGMSSIRFDPDELERWQRDGRVQTKPKLQKQ